MRPDGVGGAAELVTIQQKLGVGSKLEAVLIALRDGLIAWPSPVTSEHLFLSGEPQFDGWSIAN